MTTYLASIERSNRKDVPNVQVEVTVTELSPGRHSWAGKFVSRSADGILPNERLALSLETGQKATARVSHTEFDNRKPDTTLVHLTGTSPLAYSNFTPSAAFARSLCGAEFWWPRSSHHPATPSG